MVKLYQRVKVLWWYQWRQTGTITPSEIESLWYYDYSGGHWIYVEPQDTIIFANVCHGYSDSSSGMAHAWVDYGAKAFVGTTINAPVYENGQRVNDQYVGAFWEELCENEGTIRSATIALCNNYGHNWNLGDEWKIMGNQYATLP